MSKRKYNREELHDIVKKSLSIADVCRKLFIRPSGGNYKIIKKYLNEFKIDIDHFTGRGWNIGKRYRRFGKSIELDDILVENSTYTNTSLLRRRLIKSNLKENKCEECSIENWNNKHITFHLDHINGNNMDNRIENLRILCPNCHSQTSTYCIRNKKSIKLEYKKDEYVKNKNISIQSELRNLPDNKIEMGLKDKNIKKCECGKVIKKESRLCNVCYKVNSRKVERPPIELLINDIDALGYKGTGRKYGVSDNAIRKWIKYYQNKINGDMPE